MLQSLKIIYQNLQYNFYKGGEVTALDFLKKICYNIYRKLKESGDLFMRFITDNEYYCTKCGLKGMPIVRIKGKEREAGHLKKLWCLNCGKETNHVECRTASGYRYQEFMFEFENGNFDENGNRKMTIGELKNKLLKEGAI